MKTQSLATKLVASLCILLTAGCAIAPVPLTQKEIQARVARDLDRLQKDQEPLGGPVDLYQAMARALKYNLDMRVEVMNTMLAHQQLNLAHYSMLPRLVANAGFDGRDNYSGGISRSLLTGRDTLEPSTSADKNIFSADLTLSWNVLDFGLSYVRAQQAADDVLVAEEEKRKVAIRVMQDVRNAYWRAVSAEQLLDRLGSLDKWVTKAIDNARAVQRERLDNPLPPLQYQRELMNSQREIQRLYRDLATAKTELATMIGLRPGEPFQIAVPKSRAVLASLPLPVENMEERALLTRPELRTVDYRKRINAKETKAALLELLPNLNLQIGGNWNGNTLLFNKEWLAYGSRVSWNLLSLFRTPLRMKTIEAQKALLDAQSLAMTMTVMSQVHVGMARFAYAQKEYQTAKTYHDTQLQIAEHTYRSQVANRISEQVLLQERVGQAVAEVRYYASQAELEMAYASLLSAVGEDLLPEKLDSSTVAGLADAIRHHWTALSGAV